MYPLFSTVCKEVERMKNKQPMIHSIPLSEIDDFPDHPFQVRLDEDMQLLVESIKERGLITPIILRQKEDGRFEIVSGHRRKKACEIAGLESISAEIREMNRDEAIIMMVESNLQRTVILPSEKARAYKMKLEAMKRLPGRPAKDNSCPVVTDLKGTRSDEKLAESAPDSARQIQRYIRLLELIPELLEKVDERRIAMRPAVELSYLRKEEQSMLADAMDYFCASPSHSQAIRLRSLSKNKALVPDAIVEIISEEKPNQKDHISIRFEDARKYIPDDVPYSKTREFIMKALQYYHQYLKSGKMI